MATLRFESIVPQPIERVWQRFQDVRGLLPALTPPAQGLIVEKVELEPPQLGTRVHLSIRGPLGRMQLIAQYADFQPPHATITGTEARFVDDQIKGPFKRWTQSHEFESAGDHATRCIDVIDYALPLSVIGMLADIIAMRWIIRRTFSYRHCKMAEIFGR